LLKLKWFIRGLGKKSTLTVERNMLKNGVQDFGRNSALLKVLGGIVPKHGDIKPLIE